MPLDEALESLRRSAEDGDCSRWALDSVIDHTRWQLVVFALWMSPVWDHENADDVEAAERCVDHFLAGGER